MSGPRLITDADVIAGRVVSPIVLGPGVLLTPAARDRAVARGWVIVEADGSSTALPARSREPPAAGGCPCGAAAAPCGCSGQVSAGPACDPALASLPDGVYLVRVQQGAAQVVRPLAGKGVGDPSTIRRAPPR